MDKEVGASVPEVPAPLLGARNAFSPTRTPRRPGPRKRGPSGATPDGAPDRLAGPLELFEYQNVVVRDGGCCCIQDAPLPVE